MNATIYAGSVFKRLVGKNFNVTAKSDMMIDLRVKAREKRVWCLRVGCHMCFKGVWNSRTIIKPVIYRFHVLSYSILWEKHA